MEHIEYKPLDGFVLDQPMSRWGLAVQPGPEGQALVQWPAEMTRQQFERQYNILRSELVLALGRMPQPGESVPIQSLALSQPREEEALAAIWFAKACQSDDKAGVVIAVYNGFGALPGGFPAAERRAKQYLGDQGASRFMAWVQGAKTQENDLAERTPQPLGQSFWAEVDPDVLRRALRQACLDCRSGQGQG